MSGDDILDRYRAAVADDLRLLARLHEREPDAETLGHLRSERFPVRMALQPQSQEALDAANLIVDALTITPTRDYLDALAVDFADIYLTHALRVSPCESVWFDDEGLERQAAMFEVREAYRRHGLVMRRNADHGDDHLVPQLDFIAYLLAEGELAEAAGFMDHHLLRWLGRFAEGAAAHCATHYYRGLLLLTGRYLEQVRNHLAIILDAPRPDPEALERELAAARPEEPPTVCFVPGSAPVF